MNNEPRAVDPPEILAIKRAFGKLPSKLTYKDGVIRFKYLRPIDILPGVAIITGLLWLGFKLLTMANGSARIDYLGLIVLSVSLGPIYLFLQWLIPRWGATAILTREGIGLEKNGNLVHFHKWIQINKMSIGTSMSSPIILWSSAGAIGKIPTLLSVFSFSTKKYHDLHGAILTAFSKESAPYFIDLETDEKLAGKPRWVRPLKSLILPSAATFLTLIVGPYLLRFSESLGNIIIFMAAPWILIGIGVSALNLTDLASIRNQRHTAPSGQIVSAGNSNLQFDLDCGYLLSTSERQIYAYMGTTGQDKYATSVAAITTTCLVFALSTLILSSRISLEAKTIPILMIGILSIFFITMTRQAVLTVKSFDCHLVFDQDRAFVLRNGEMLPIESFGSKKQSYEEFKHNPKLSMGVLRVNLKDHSRYFSTSSMVSLSDQEIMEFLPDENRL